jgi:N-acetylneuraminic acid mutarotase
MRKPVRVASRLTFVVLVAGLLSTGAVARPATSLSAASPVTDGLQLTVGVTNKGPLTSCDGQNPTPCPLASVTQFLLYVHNTNPLANFTSPPTPDRTNVPNAYVLSSMDFSITVDGAPLPGGAETVTPPPNAQFPAQSGRWPATVVCTPPTGPPPCTTVESPAILPGETTAADFIGWTHGSQEPNGKYIFTFTLHGTLNGQPVDLTATSPTIVMKTATAPGWATAAPMPTARVYLAAATGRDGRIYAIGGYNASGTPLNTVEAYTPSTNTWATMAPMPTARFGLAAATGPDGRIYAIGGSASGGADLNTVEAYTPSTNTWATVAPMPTARTLLAAATGPDGRIYAIGGLHNNCCGLNTVEAYKPSTNSWATVASMPTARWGIAAATGPDGRIYAFGGQNDLTTAEAYTASANSWATVASMSTGRYTPAAATGPDGLVYVMGGDLNYVALSAVEAYTASTDSWATAPPMPTGRRGLAAATGHDGRIYAIGGTTGEGHTPTTVNTVEAYTPG